MASEVGAGRVTLNQGGELKVQQEVVQSVPGADLGGFDRVHTNPPFSAETVWLPRVTAPAVAAKGHLGS